MRDGGSSTGCGRGDRTVRHRIDGRLIVLRIVVGVRCLRLVAFSLVVDGLRVRNVLLSHDLGRQVLLDRGGSIVGCIADRRQLGLELRQPVAQDGLDDRGVTWIDGRSRSIRPFAGRRVDRHPAVGMNAARHAGTNGRAAFAAKHRAVRKFSSADLAVHDELPFDLNRLLTL